MTLWLDHEGRMEFWALTELVARRHQPELWEGGPRCWVGFVLCGGGIPQGAGTVKHGGIHTGTHQVYAIIHLFL